MDYQYLCGLELSPKMDNGLEIRNALRNVRGIGGCNQEPGFCHCEKAP